MVVPRIIPRAEHPISRRDIDPDALKVLYRLRQFDHVAYLVGGSVRDLLLGRRPKDFDIGTSAHPYQVKKLFRNCWIIGRRFRLAHVRFGPKVIEVATFRRQLQPGEEVVQDGVPAPDPSTPEGEHLIHHDNTFGTPEEDAFRRDFTINALAYDIATFSIIDYVGGLEDLRAGVVRSIGNPEVRLREDPVRMLRAIALAARLQFTIDEPVLDAIRTYRQEIAQSSAPRLLEEYYKILRAGASERTFRMLAEVGLLEPISTELHRGATDPLWRSLSALDSYRHRFESIPDTLTNAILLGSLLVPLGTSVAGGRSRDHVPGSTQDAPRLGALPLARRDIERLRQILALQRRLRDVGASRRAQRALVHRSLFLEALTWLEIHGEAPDLVGHWKTVLAEAPDGKEGEVSSAAETPAPGPHRRRRRRRRRRPPIRPVGS
ncbi:MAG TPA: polynucleotide adenylyltransferase PcnB [Vicinamibacterales bacterium]|nr:polynucleotide adenylyltransferase PcnB [Vicinamibacterales bacterium]